MRPLSYALALASVVALPLAAQTPSRWSVEVNADAAIPTRSLAGADLRTGFGLGANLRFRLQPHLAAYGGWEYHHFRTDQLIPNRTETFDVEDTGYTFGLRFEHPLRGEGIPGASGPSWFVRAGGLATHIETENDAGSLVGDTGHGLGFEVGGGMALPLGSRLVVTPGVRYRSLSRDLTLVGTTRRATLAYVTAGVGATFSF